MIFDTHTHSYFPGLADRQYEIVEDMDARGVRYAVQVGCDITTSRQAIDLAKTFPEHYYAAVGIHPSECQSTEGTEELMGQVETLLTESIYNGVEPLKSDEICVRDEHRSEVYKGYIEPRAESQTQISRFSGASHIVGIGETGLDYHYPITGDREKRVQRQFFEAHIALANRYHLPVIIHSRDAREDTFDVLREYPPERFVLHCYAEDFAFARQCLDAFSGAYFSFSGIITYRKTDAIRETVSGLPLDRILVETDAPFISPQAVRSEMNRPGNVTHVLKAVQSLRRESPEEVERQIYENSLRFYGIAA